MKRNHHLRFLLSVVLFYSVTGILPAQETQEFSIAGYHVLTAHRSLNNRLPEERVVLCRGANEKPIWVGAWGHTVSVAAYAKSGVKSDFLQPDVTGDGSPKLYAWVSQDSDDFIYSLVILKLGATVQILDKFPACPGEHPDFEPAANGGFVTVSVEQFVPLVEGRPVDVPTQTVILIWKNGAFHAATRRMRKTEPTAAALSIQAQGLQNLFGRAPADEMNENGEPWKLWVEAADLAWSGHEPAATRLIEKAWPARRGELKKQETSFLNQLRRNRWYREMNPPKTP